MLFSQLQSHLVDADTNDFTFNTIYNADVAESQVSRAGELLEAIYDSGNVSRLSRATTPAFVRDSVPVAAVPGAFPALNEQHKARDASTVYDRLYPDIQKHDHPVPSTTLPTSPSKSHFLRFTRSIAKLTQSFHQESSFLSALPSKRHTPRVSDLPSYPPVDDISIAVDESAEYAVVVSMYEVHNDRIFDLLAVPVAGKAMQKRRALLFKNTQASPERKVVAGLQKVICSTLEEALLILETGLQERQTTGTGSNAASSRSHAFFNFDIKKRRGGSLPGPWSSSTMTIVDLAGSERARTAKTAGATLAEGGKINESLMYLGQCMQMQSDNAHSTTPNLVPFRQCKLTELFFSNSLTNTGPNYRSPQKAIMIVTADPLGDFNATSQILRYSALARTAINIRTPSNTQAILAGAVGSLRPGSTSGRATPANVMEDLENALDEIHRLREELEITQLRLEEQSQRAIDFQIALANSEEYRDELEAEIRQEVADEMDRQMELNNRRMLAARDEERDQDDEHWDRKVEILSRGIHVYEDEDEENIPPEAEADAEVDGLAQRVSSMALRGQGKKVGGSPDPARLADLEDENARLRAQLANMQREKGLRSPSKKMRVLKARKWDESGMGGLDDGL